MVWQSWHEDSNNQKETKKRFEARVKQVKAGKDIDLVCNCRSFRGQDDVRGLQVKYPCDCNGYRLKKYIEFIANN